METISAFIDGGGSVLVAASSDIGKSALVCSRVFDQVSMELRALYMWELPRWLWLGKPWPGVPPVLSCDQRQ